MASRAEGSSKRTTEFYRYTLTNFVGYPMTPEGVSSYLKSLTCGNGKAKFYQALRTLLLRLYCNGHIQDKVIDRIPMPKVQRRLLPAVSKEQLEILMNHCHCERDRALLSFLWYSGTRLSEAANVKAQDCGSGPHREHWAARLSHLLSEHALWANDRQEIGADS